MQTAPATRSYTTPLNWCCVWRRVCIQAACRPPSVTSLHRIDHPYYYTWRPTGYTCQAMQYTLEDCHRLTARNNAIHWRDVSIWACCVLWQVATVNIHGRCIKENSIVTCCWPAPTYELLYTAWACTQPTFILCLLTAWTQTGLNCSFIHRGP